MFFLLPISIFVVSIGLIGYLSFKKFGYLKKLTPETANGQNPGIKGFVEELFPEVFGYAQKIDLKGHKAGLLVEIEKLLRKLRVITLKIDAFSHRLISRIRVSNLNHEKATMAEEAAKDNQIEEDKEITKFPHLLSDEDLKKEEQKLIIEIAKSPKDVELYKVLGNVYMHLKQYSDAKDSFTSALKLEPENEWLKRMQEKAEKMSENLPT